MARLSIPTLVSALKKEGMLLVYPEANKSRPASLWSVFFPRARMKWEWTDDADDRVASIWRFRTRLSESGRAVYLKWYRGRATFVDRELFVVCLKLFHFERPLRLSREAREILQLLEENSPLSGKELRRMLGLQGKRFEATYQSSLKELWLRFLIVGYGEVDDGAFPSLAIGATRLLFEDLYRKAGEMNLSEAQDSWEQFAQRQPQLAAFARRAREKSNAS
jgi:hypothetical protein